jgi:hypothetical protein
METKKKEYRIKFLEDWYTAELCSHPDVQESYFLVAGHIILKKDVEAYYSLEN